MAFTISNVQSVVLVLSSYANGLRADSLHLHLLSFTFLITEVHVFTPCNPSL